MPSPFPGMNPYLEQDAVWHDFHNRFLTHASEALIRQVRPKYIVQTEELLFLHEEPAERRRLLGRADMSVTIGSPNSAQGAGTATAVAPAPTFATLPAEVDIEKHRYLEIRDRATRRLVTALELLSPSNKRPGPDREQYRGKRLRLTHAGTHFIELDLLRGGPRLPLDGLPPCDYYAMVARAEDHPRVAVWPLGLRDPLPTVPVPLRAPDPDAKLDLQALLHQVYDAAGYEDYLYASEPQPVLSPEERDWAGSVLRSVAS